MLINESVALLLALVIGVDWQVTGVITHEYNYIIVFHDLFKASHLIARSVFKYHVLRISLRETNLFKVLHGTRNLRHAAVRSIEDVYAQLVDCLQILSSTWHSEGFSRITPFIPVFAIVSVVRADKTSFKSTVIKYSFISIKNDC